MSARRLLFWLHLSVGITVGGVVAFLAITGSILSFQRQVITWSERNVTSGHLENASCLPTSQILANATAAAHDDPVSWVSFADRRRPSVVEFSKGKVFLVDSCDGRILDSNAGQLRGFFRQVEDLHRHLAWGGIKHERLQAIKNACVLGLLFLLASGFILWVPRQWTWKHIRTRLVPRWFGMGRASEWSLHSVAGFWLVLPLLCLVLTGLVMAYAWANALLYRAAGEPPPRVHAEREAVVRNVLPVQGYRDLDPLIARACKQDPAWASLSLRISAQRKKNIVFVLDEGDGRDPRTKSQLTLNRKTAEVVRWTRYLDNSRGRRWRLLAPSVHTGELFGPAGQTVVFITAMGTLLLVITGFSLAIRRWQGWRSRGLRKAPSARHAKDVAVVANSR